MYWGKIKVKIFTDSKLNFAIPIEIRKISIGQLRRIKRGKGERKIVVVTDYAIIRVLSW